MNEYFRILTALTALIGLAAFTALNRPLFL
jgi:hypothetical protein